jgi:hypothetical protein
LANGRACKRPGCLRAIWASRPPRRLAGMQSRRQAGGHAASDARGHRQDGHGLPEKRSAANPIRQAVPLLGQAEPDRPLMLAASRNRPALGVSSNEGDRDSGAPSNREGWLVKVWKGQRALPFRCRASDRDAVGGGLFPRRDRTQISEAPQALESLHSNICAVAMPHRRQATFRPSCRRLASCCAPHDLRQWAACGHSPRPARMAVMRRLRASRLLPCQGRQQDASDPKLPLTQPRLNDRFVGLWTICQIASRAALASM